MTIHSSHPFLEPEPDRDPVRRLRGRLGGAVSLWTAGSGRSRAGLTVTSFMVAPGDPGRVVGLVDPDSELAETAEATRTAVVQLLSWSHRDLADAFAGVAPAPGGPFRMADWQQTTWGPRLDRVSAWAGIRFDAVEPLAHRVGWSVLLDGMVEEIRIEEDEVPLVHRRGRYVRPAAGDPPAADAPG